MRNKLLLVLGLIAVAWIVWNVTATFQATSTTI